jgi:hypothetical protein
MLKGLKVIVDPADFQYGNFFFKICYHERSSLTYHHHFVMVVKEFQDDRYGFKV